MIDDRTRYDIGEPFMSVRFKGGTISHTPKGIVVSVDTGTRYTCTYGCLLSYLRAGSLEREKIEQTNIFDVIDDFKKYSKNILDKAKKIDEDLEKKGFIDSKNI